MKKEQPQVDEVNSAQENWFLSHFPKIEAAVAEAAGEGTSAKQEVADETMEQAEGEAGPQKLSKKQRKKLTRLTVAELKRLVQRPDLVKYV